MSSALSAKSTPRSIIYLGMDVHKDSIAIAVLPSGAKTPTRLERLPNDLAKLVPRRATAIVGMSSSKQRGAITIGPP